MDTFQLGNAQLQFDEMVHDHGEHSVTQGNAHRQRQTFKQIKGITEIMFLHGMTIRIRLA